MNTREALEYRSKNNTPGVVYLRVRCETCDVWVDERDATHRLKPKGKKLLYYCTDHRPTKQSRLSCAGKSLAHVIL
jgi:ferredoxin